MTHLSMSNLLRFTPDAWFTGVNGFVFASTLLHSGVAFFFSRIFVLWAFCRRDFGVCGVSKSRNARSLLWGGDPGDPDGERSQIPGTCCSSSSSISSKFKVTETGDILLERVILRIRLGLGIVNGEAKSTSRKSPVIGGGSSSWKPESSSSSYVNVLAIQPSPLFGILLQRVERCCNVDIAIYYFQQQLFHDRRNEINNTNIPRSKHN